MLVDTEIGAKAKGRVACQSQRLFYALDAFGRIPARTQLIDKITGPREWMTKAGLSNCPIAIPLRKATGFVECKGRDQWMGQSYNPNTGLLTSSR